MELSQQVLDGLILSGDSAHIPDKSFSILVTRAFDGLLDERHKNLVSSKFSAFYNFVPVSYLHQDISYRLFMVRVSIFHIITFLTFGNIRNSHLRSEILLFSVKT